MFRRSTTASVLPWIIPALIAVTILVVAATLPDGSLKIWLQLVGVIVGLGAAVEYIDWMLIKVTDRVWEFRNATAITERVKIIERVKDLNQDQLRFLQSEAPVISMLPGSIGPIQMFRTQYDKEVPYDFVCQFMEMSDGKLLPPIRTWPEGTERRDWAQSLTNHFIVHGLAIPANGNKPAVWKDWAMARAWTGMEVKK